VAILPWKPKIIHFSTFLTALLVFLDECILSPPYVLSTPPPPHLVVFLTA
jgi:hypothetical protein